MLEDSDIIGTVKSEIGYRLGRVCMVARWRTDDRSSYQLETKEQKTSRPSKTNMNRRSPLKTWLYDGNPER